MHLIKRSLFQNITKYFFFLPICIAAIFTSCKKLVQIPPPVSSITTSQVFADSADATAAISGIYSSLINTEGTISVGSGSISIDCGTSADELVPFVQGSGDPTDTYR